MHKNIMLLQIGFLLVCLKSAAMQPGDIVQDIVKSPSFSLQIIKCAQAPLEVVMTTPVVVPSRFCTIKDFGRKLILLCKRHPVAITAGIAIVAAIIIYCMVPVVKDDEFDNCVFNDRRTFPQERIDCESRSFESDVL